MEHVVTAGETLSAIAAMYGTDWQTLARINRISNPNLLRIGQRLTVPARFVTVRRGDTLSGIAARTGVSAGSLAAANGISNPDRIQVGQTLRIPSGGGARAAARPAPRPSAARPGRQRRTPSPPPPPPPAPASDNRYVRIIQISGDRQARDDLAAGLKVLVALHQCKGAYVRAL